MDLTAASLYQAQIARGIADALSIPLILVHVIEPLEGPLTTRPHVASIETNRRAAAEEGLDELLATIPRRLHPEALVVYGDPAEEVAKVTRDRQAGLVVMGLHGSPILGPRMVCGDVPAALRVADSGSRASTEARRTIHGVTSTSRRVDLGSVDESGMMLTIKAALKGVRMIPRLERSGWCLRGAS